MMGLRGLLNLRTKFPAANMLSRIQMVFLEEHIFSNLASFNFIICEESFIYWVDCAIPRIFYVLIFTTLKLYKTVYLRGNNILRKVDT